MLPLTHSHVYIKGVDAVKIELSLRLHRAPRQQLRRHTLSRQPWARPGPDLGQTGARSGAVWGATCSSHRVTCGWSDDLSVWSRHSAPDSICVRSISLFVPQTT